jgi:hypothetical protein
MPNRLSRFQVGFVIATPIFGTLAISIGLLQEFGQWQNSSILVFVIGLIGIAWFWLSYSLIAFEISMDGPRLDFRSMRGRSSIPCSDIVSIDAREWNRGLICIRHRRGTFYLLRSMKGALPLVHEIHKANPAVSVRQSSPLHR